MQNNKLQRLDKVVAKICGISRADAQRIIRRGFVTISDEIVKKPDMRYDFSSCKICINDVEYSYSEYLYIMMNKPQNTVCTSSTDEQSVLNILPEELFRTELFTVGRLDKDTTGLLLITNDGAFAHKLISPKKQVPKCYRAQLDEPLTEQDAQRLLVGITLKDGDNVCATKITFENDERTLVNMTINTGKYHQVKRMFAAVSNHVASLHRFSIGGLSLDDKLALGDARLMSEDEINSVFVQNI